MEMISFIAINVLSRLIPHAPNVATIGATSLVMGAKYGVKKSMIVLFVSMLITDMVQGLHSVMWATYGSFVIAILIGKWISKHYTQTRIISGTVLSSVIFFLVTNFAVWYAPNFMYEKTFSGLLECYGMAIPFFRNSLVGDMMYAGIFFGGFELVSYLKRRYAVRLSIKK